MWLLFSLAATAAEIEGSWSLANSPEAVQAEISRGVDASAAAFPTLFLSMVRSKLSRIPEVCDAYVFRVDDDQIDAWVRVYFEQGHEGSVEGLVAFIAAEQAAGRRP